MAINTITDDNIDPNKGVAQQTIQQPAPPPFAIKEAAKAPEPNIRDNIQRNADGSLKTTMGKAPEGAIPSFATQKQLDPSQVTVKPIQTVTDPQVQEVKSVEATPITSGVTEPPRKGIDFTEQEQQLEELRQAQVLQAEQDAANQARDIKNQFSHLASRNKDSGFINSRNLAAFRDANRTLNDKKLNLNNQFSRDIINLGMEKARQDAEFNNENYQAWQNSNMDTINTFLDAGDFDAATDYALALSEVDDNPTWDKFKNPKYLDILRENFDVEANNNFRTGILSNVNDIATRAGSFEGFQRKQAKDSILNLLDTQPLSGEGYVMDFFSFVEPKDYDELGISEEDSAIVDRYKKGEIDFKDPTLREIFSEAYIRDINKKMNDANLEASLSGVSDTVKNNSIGTSIIQNLLGDSSGSSITFDPNDSLTGSTITEFSMYNNAINADNIGQIVNVPGLDVFFEDWNGDAFVDLGDESTYTMEDARDDKMMINGTVFSQGELTDMYLDYHKDMRREFDKITDPTQKSNFEAMNKEQFLRSVEEAVSNGVTTIDGIEQAVRGQRTVDGELLEGNEVMIDGKPVSFEDLEVDPNSIENERVRNLYIGILEGNESLHSLDDNQMKQLLLAGATSDDFFNPAIVDQLKQSGDLISFRSPTQLQGAKVTDKNHPFSTENLADTLKSLDFEDGSGSVRGFIEMDGKLYTVDGQPGSHHPSKDGKWESVIEWNLTPLFDTEGSQSIPYRTRFPITGKSNTSSRARALATEWLSDGNLFETIG
jgi:hypothetical protein